MQALPYIFIAITGGLSVASFLTSSTFLNIAL